MFTAAHAEQFGCAALILYSDPADYTVPGEGVYPDTWHLPGTGAQRGTLNLVKGDPQTLHYPSIRKSKHNFDVFFNSNATPYDEK